MGMGITLEDDRGRKVFMNIGLLPMILPPQTLHYLRECASMVIDAVRRIIPAWMEDRTLRELLSLWPEEEEFVRAVWTPAQARTQPAVARLDTSVGGLGPALRHSAMFYEVNNSCVGGMHYEPAGELFLQKVIFPKLPRALKSRLTRQEDLRDIIWSHLEAHRRRVGLRPGTLVLLEDRDARGGITEYPSMVQYYRRRGIDALLADPREVEGKNGDLTVRGRRVSLFFRNVEVRDIVSMERRVGFLKPIREAFRQHRMVSALVGEFDHKSLWEVFTDPRYQRLFTPQQRRVFRSHLPWTRLIRDVRTTLPGGRSGELLPYLRRHRELHVLKPNRSCGGTGVTIGYRVTQPTWERTLERALKDRREGWVVQELVPAYRKRLPLLHVREGLLLEPVFVNYGVVSCPEGNGVLGRVCRQPIVNVSRGGAQVPTFHGV
jgi:hypothetical protein